MLNKIVSNKVFLYLIFRYLIFIIQFLSSIYIAIELGPYYYGIWGFMLLLISYLAYFNLGISSSLNILMIQNKTEEIIVKDIVANSIVLTGFLSSLIILLALYYFVFGIRLFEKYELGNYFYVICIIGILFHFNSLLGTIYRVKNRLFELAFFQSIIPIVILISFFVAKGKTLLPILLYMTLLGNVASLILFVVNKRIPLGGLFSVKGCVKVLNKGFYLFIYNTSFFLIVLSTRTLISYFYETEDFGYFTFSYTLANAVLLLLQALAIIIFPKIIDKLNENSVEEVEKTKMVISINYVTLSYGLMFSALMFFPIFIDFIPKYQGTLKVLNLIAVTVLLHTNTFAYTSHLMAQNKERLLSGISLISLLLNISISLVLILFFQVSFEYVIISTLISYCLFSYLCAKHSLEISGVKKSFVGVINDFLPTRLLIPYLLAVFMTLMKFKYVIFIPLLLFLLFNRVELKSIMNTIKRIISRPNIIDIKEN